jgi:FkbM family methyltransferase
MISFYIPPEHAIDLVDIDSVHSLPEDVRRSWNGIPALHWVLQTFLELQHLLGECKLTNRIDTDGIIVAAANTISPNLRLSKNAFLVCIMGDSINPPSQADYLLIQNPKQATFGIPFSRVFLWPQEDLIPRDAARGSIVQNICYHGCHYNLHPSLATPSWNWICQASGIIWNVVNESKWGDFRQTDISLAIRQPSPRSASNKPPTKLFLAWSAGVPLVASEDSAYLDLKRSNLDYIAANNSAEAYDAIRKLRVNPSLYMDMVENGRDRAKLFTRKAIKDVWMNAFDDVRLTFGQKSTKFGYQARRSASIHLRKNFRRLTNATERISAKTKTINRFQFPLSWSLSSGLKITLSSWSDWVTYNDIFVDGEYDEFIKIILSTSKNVDCQIYDVGANTGFFMLRLFHQAILANVTIKQVDAFEASVRTFGLLTHCLEANPEMANLVDLHLGAVGYRCDVSFYDDRHSMSSRPHHLLPEGITKRLHPSTRVKGIMPSSCRKCDVYFLKIDIEGSERDLLDDQEERAFIQGAKGVLIETHGPEAKALFSRHFIENPIFKCKRVRDFGTMEVWMAIKL